MFSVHIRYIHSQEIIMYHVASSSLTCILKSKYAKLLGQALESGFLSCSSILIRSYQFQPFPKKKLSYHTCNQLASSFSRRRDRERTCKSLVSLPSNSSIPTFSTHSPNLISLFRETKAQS